MREEPETPRRPDSDSTSLPLAAPRMFGVIEHWTILSPRCRICGFEPIGQTTTTDETGAW